MKLTDTENCNKAQIAHLNERIEAARRAARYDWPMLKDTVAVIKAKKQIKTANKILENFNNANKEACAARRKSIFALAMRAEEAIQFRSTDDALRFVKELEDALKILLYP